MLTSNQFSDLLHIKDENKSKRDRGKFNNIGPSCMVNKQYPASVPDVENETILAASSSSSVEADLNVEARVGMPFIELLMWRGHDLRHL